MAIRDWLSESPSLQVADSAPSSGLGIYVINLKRAPERWFRMEYQLSAALHQVYRVEAFDGTVDRDGVLAVRGLSLEDGKKFIYRCNPYLSNGRPYRVTEEACFLSHLETLQQFLSSKHAFALILEDDAIIPSGFFDEGGPLAYALTHDTIWDLVKLEGCQHPDEDRPCFVHHEGAVCKLVASIRPSNGSAAYLVSRLGARRLLQGGLFATEPYDVFLTDIGRHSARLLDLSPFPVRQSGVPSMIGSAEAANLRTARARLMRTWSKGIRRLLRVSKYTYQSIARGKPIRHCKW